MSASARLSVRLQDIAQSLADVLTDVAGEPVPFVLVLQADKAAQYVSNCDRKDGSELIESLLAPTTEQEPVFTPQMIEAIYAAWHGAGVDIAGGNWTHFVGMLPRA